MSDIYYNIEKKEIAIILGYGIGSHLSFNYLREVILDIRRKFPKLSVAAANNMLFLEAAQSSRRHRNMFYTRFEYDLSMHKIDGHGCYIPITDDEDSDKAYIICSHKKGVDGWMQEDESAENLMSRMIHD